MRDIYDLINEVEIDEDEMIEMEVSEFEKEKVKRSLKKTVNKKRRKRNGFIAAGICAAVIGGFAILGTVDPVYAGELPVIGDIFRFLDNRNTGAFDKYKENSNEINVTKKSKGVSVTIIDAVFDGKVITCTYEVKSDKKLGDKSCNLMYSPQFAKDDEEFIEGYDGSVSVHSDSTNVGNGKFVGTTQITLEDDYLDSIDLTVNFNSYINRDSNKEGFVKGKGKWSFNLSLEAVDITEKDLDESTTKDDITVNISKIKITPMSFTLSYSQILTDELVESFFDKDKLSMEEQMEASAQIMFKKNVHLEVKDDLGNKYEAVDEGGKGEDDRRTDWVKTYGKLDDNATKLILSPSNEETVFDDIIIELDR